MSALVNYLEVNFRLDVDIIVRRGMPAVPSSKRGIHWKHEVERRGRFNL